MIGQLASGAMFFGMISYEYVTTTSSEDNNQNTKILSLRNIQLCGGRKKLHQKDEHLEREAEYVSMTFKFQNNRQKQTIAQLQK